MPDYVPTSIKRYSQWRGPTSSGDYNSFVGETYSDLVRLYNLLKDLDERMRSYFSQVVKEDTLIRRKIDKLSQDMEDIEEGEVIYRRFYESTNLLDVTVEGDISAEEQLSIDTLHGIMTLPQLGEISNLTYTDSIGTTAVPPSLAFQFFSDTPAEASVGEGNIYFSLTPQRNLVWERLCVFEEVPKSNVELEVYVKVPLDIIENIQSNCIIMHLFPSYFVDLIDLSYTIDVAPVSNLSELSYLSWDHYYPTREETMRWVPPNEKKENTYIENAKPLRFDFDPEEITALRFKLRQRNWLREFNDANSIWVMPMGASFISLENRRYRPQGRKVIRFEAPPGEKFFSIKSIDPLIYNYPASSYGNIYSHRLFYSVEGISKEIDVGQLIPNGTHEVFLEVTLYEPKGHGTPALTGVRLTYSTS